MNTTELLAIVVDALEDVKAQALQVYDTTPITNLFERVIICTGTSNRQTRALASNIREKVKGAGEEILGVEGEDTGEWVLVDMGSIVVHIMQAPIREYYRLEELWGAHPMELADVRKPAAKPRKVAVKKATFIAEPESDDDTPVKKPVARKVAAKKAALTLAAGSTGAAPAKTAAAKKVPASKPPATKVAAKKATSPKATTKRIVG